MPSLSPFVTLEWDWWRGVLTAALVKMPVALPFALATIVGGIDCTESAAAAGDEYDTRTILLTEGVASVVAGLLGGVIQTTPYIGHPAYKTMGGRSAYTLATALFVGAVGCFGVFGVLFEFLPSAALFPVLVFVGLEITAQSFHATPVKHYPALAPQNAMLLLFSALPEQVRYAADHYQRRSSETSTLLDLLLKRYREEGVTMAMTMEEFRKYYLKYNLKDLTAEERLEGLTPEERLKGLPPEELLKMLPREEIENYLKRLKNGSPPATAPGSEGGA